MEIGLSGKCDVMRTNRSPLFEIARVLVCLSPHTLLSLTLAAWSSTPRSLGIDVVSMQSSIAQVDGQEGFLRGELRLHKLVFAVQHQTHHRKYDRCHRAFLASLEAALRLHREGSRCRFRLHRLSQVPPTRKPPPIRLLHFSHFCE